MRYLFLGLTCILFLSFTQDKPAYRLFDADGNPAGFDDLTKAVPDKDLIFFGERHNNPVAHWFRQELLMEVHKNSQKELILGLEMFERDDQILLDEFTQDLIPENNFENEAKLWPNYTTDYKPMVQWAADSDIPLFATNIPRRYAAMVARHGTDILDTLSQNALEYITPLPLEVDMTLKTYREMLEMAGHHGTENMVKAQAIKDATMAHSILEHFKAGENRLFHVNGAYHTLYGEGIIWYINQQQPDLSALSIITVEQENINTLKEEHHNKGDFLLVIPENMTKTH